MNRSEMFKTVPFHPDADLLMAWECPGCGYALRTSGKLDSGGKLIYDRCEICHPPSCGRCPGHCEVYQSDHWRGFLARCTSCHEVRPLESGVK